jgi:Domain of unknown function (DUF1844)
MTNIDTRGEKVGRPFTLPPATFEFLTESLRLQAEMQLGLMRVSEEEEPPRDLDLARHTIDLLGMLQEKTRGNLSLEEQRLLENSLTLLRFRYVQAVEESKEAPESPKPEGGQPAPESGQAANQS